MRVLVAPALVRHGRLMRPLLVLVLVLVLVWLQRALPALGTEQQECGGRQQCPQLALLNG